MLPRRRGETPRVVGGWRALELPGHFDTYVDRNRKTMQESLVSLPIELSRKRPSSAVPDSASSPEGASGTGLASS
jgi:hypothetical protein